MEGPVDPTPRWLAGGLTPSFDRVQILVSFYDGDPERWREAIARGEMPGDEADLQFLANVARRMKDDPRLIEDLMRPAHL